jgi:pilus assembly protein FimV
MNMNYVIFRSSALGGILLLGASSSLAVSLGPVRGAALVGRTLDLSVLVRLDASDDAAALCTEVELSYSDTRIDAAKINVRTSATAEPGQALVRVTSSAIVDEPVVNLNLRAGCAAKNSRRYVLLADLPLQAAERPLPVIPSAPPAAAKLPTAPSGSSRGAGTDSEGSVSGASTSPNGASPPVRPVVRPPRRPRVTPSTGETPVSRDNATSKPAVGASLSQSLRLGQSAKRKPGTPRLQLDSADLLAESAPSLKSFSELQSLPSESNPRRSEFAALWRALNLRPDEVARDAQRLDELQAQTRSLRDVNGKNQTELGLAREQLKKAEVERYANPLVYTLMALLAALLLGAGYLYYRLKNTHRSAAWWDQRDAEPVKPAKSVALAEPRSVDSRIPTASGPVVVPEPQGNVVALEENFMPGFRAAESTFPPSGISASGRGVNVNELFDIAQQAYFFVSLGQHDHAIEVLSDHIRDNVQTSPLAYLDLFKLYHDMDKQPEYEELRVEFNRIFNAEVPPFQEFRQHGDGLEAYQGAMTRIQSLWNTPRVLDVIEESLFRKPGRPTEAFGLEAYRELLLLYAIANELIDSPRQPDFDPTALPGSPGGGFSSAAEGQTDTDEYLTELQPLRASAAYGGGEEMSALTSAAVMTPRTGRVGLDIDLTDAWLGVDSPDGDDTVVLAAHKSDAFQPSSSAWLDFDLSDIGSAEGDSGGVVKTRDKPSRA